MELSSVFTFRNEPTANLLALLNETELGTNGAIYRHLDTVERIKEADSPLFLSLEKKDKVVGNITFCKRGEFWYIRYFAFRSFVQASGKKKSSDKGNSFLKRELSKFFDEVFEGKHSITPVTSMYAYIEPKNDRSKWMSENFGFKKIGQIATQSFSRVYPKNSIRVEKINDWEEIKELVKSRYSDHQYFFLNHSQKPPFYILKKENEIIACAKVTRVNWEIVRLPGKMGGLLTKIIPYIPFLNKLIKPKNHTFVVPEIVVTQQNDSAHVEELFEAILFREKLNLILWWIDENDPLYINVKNKIKWGLLHKLIGVNPVDIMQRTKNPETIKNTKPVFVTGFDLV